MPTTYQRKKRQGFVLYHDDAQYLSFFEPAKVKQIMQGLVELSCALAEGNDPPAAPAELNAIELHTFNTMAEKIERDHGNYVHTCEARSRKEERPPNTQGDLSHLKASNSNGNVSETEAVVVPGTGPGNVHPPGTRAATTTFSYEEIQEVCSQLVHCGINAGPKESHYQMATALLRHYPLVWIKEACSRANGQGKLDISYVIGILKRWEMLGYIDAETKAEAAAQRANGSKGGSPPKPSINQENPWVSKKPNATASQADGLTGEEREMHRRGLM